jgi:Mg-chelatase subunit ChlD
LLKAEAPAPTPAPTSAEPLAPEELFELTGAFETFIPPAFYQVFHLARVIFSWGRVLEAGSRGALQAVAGPGGDRVQQEAPRGLASGVPVLGGYTVNPRVRRIRSFDEIGLVDASTLATHDLDRLVREAEERELWVRVPERAGVERLAEEIASVRDGGSQDALNDSEQKLYLLVDKSVSMRTAHRHVYAKALALYFLREKLRHGRNPMLFYRGFAAEITPLIRATRKRDIPQVVRELLLADPDSKGTDLQAALLTAIRDINTASLMRDAQILVITDGLGIIHPHPHGDRGHRRAGAHRGRDARPGRALSPAGHAEGGAEAPVPGPGQPAVPGHHRHAAGAARRARRGSAGTA